MSSSIIDKRYSGLRKIYKELTAAGYYEDGHIINYDDIYNNLNLINLLVHKTYIILKSDTDNNTKIKGLTGLKDPNNNRLINKATAQFIIERYSDKLVDFFDNIYNSIEHKPQVGGYDKEEFYKNNVFVNKITDTQNKVYDNITNFTNNVKYKVVNLGNNINTKVTDGIQGTSVGNIINKKYNSARSLVSDLYQSDTITKIENIFKIDDFLDIIDRLQERIGFEKLAKDLRIPTIIINAVKFGFLNSPEIIFNLSRLVFNWTLFPLYELENLPVVGIMFEIPLDIIALIIDNSDIFIQPLVTILPLGLDMALKAAGLVPGLGAAVNAAQIPLSLIRIPLEFFLANGADIVGMFLNIERKQFGLAYISALEIFPALPPLMDTLTTNLYMANKITKRGVGFTDFMSDMTYAGEIVGKHYIDDPTLVFRPKYAWDEVVYPNKDIIPVLREIPFDKIKSMVDTFKSTAFNIKDSFT